ncbi:MAG: Tn3 family transposase, partial [Actinobacteria bacterium]|nr:Tn3 family transposase [Actinomycetota bacterium]
MPPDSDDEGVKRAQLATRIATVTGFLKTLTAVIEFGASADARAVLGEMQRMPELLRSRKLSSADVDGSLVGGSWKRLVFAAPGLPDGAVDKNAYVFCVLTAFHRHLKRREIYANASTRWRDPRAQLLAGDAWRTAKPAVLTALSLPAAPDELLAGHAWTLDGAYRAVGGRLAASTAVGLDAEGQLHIERLEALQEPASLIELRRDVNALLPRVDLPEVISPGQLRWVLSGCSG